MRFCAIISFAVFVSSSTGMSDLCKKPTTNYRDQQCKWRDKEEVVENTVSDFIDWFQRVSYKNFYIIVLCQCKANLLVVRTIRTDDIDPLIRDVIVFKRVPAQTLGSIEQVAVAVKNLNVVPPRT